MANINQISPDGGTTLYDIEDPTARSSINSLTPRVGIAEGKITTLQEQMLSVQNSLDGLGTASTKNSTSVVTESSDLVESGAVKDIVGWGNKNLLVYPYDDPTRTLKGVTFTVNKDGSVTANGTATEFAIFKLHLILGNEKYIGKRVVLSGCPNGGSASTYFVNGYRASVKDGSSGTVQDIGNGVEFDFLNDGSGVKAELQVVVVQGTTVNNLVFKPMIRLATITDDTYEPYHASVEESLDDKVSYADNGVLGAKNLLQLTLDQIKNNNSGNGWTWNGNVGTINSLIFTCNVKDGFVDSIKVEGQNITTSGYIILRLINQPDNVDGLILNGCPSGGSELSYAINYSNQRTYAYWDTGNGTPPLSKFDYETYPTAGIGILVHSAYSMPSGGVVFKPMLRLASDTDPTYQPYAQTNRELTVNKCDTSVIAPTENGTTASQAYAVGSHAIRNGAFITWKNAKAQGETINDASDYTSGDVADVITDLEDGLISSTRPWSGNTLTFNIPQNNGIMYRLTAIESNSMHYVDTILVNRADGIAKHDFGEAITCSYTSGNLVITLPSTDYYMYKMEQIKNGIN